MRWMILLFLLLSAGAANAAPPGAVAAYQATYETQAFGSTLVVVNTLSHELDGVRMTMDASVSGLLRILGSFGFSRESRFWTNDREVRLLQTRMRQTTPRRERKSEATLDWVTNRAQGRVNDRTFEMDVPPGTQDFLSSLYLTMARLSAGDFHETLTVDLIERDRLRPYTMEQRGHERLDTRLGKMDTIRVARQNGSGTEVSGWFAPELGYVPVRLQYEADGRIFQFEITDFERQEEPAGRRGRR